MLVRQDDGTSVVLGNQGSLDLASGCVVGGDPLAPFGPRAREQVREVDGYATVADLMVNSRYDPDLVEVAAFEDQVSSHGGIGGPQTHPFLLHPVDLDRADRADLHLAGAASRPRRLAPRHGRRRRAPRTGSPRG